MCVKIERTTASNRQMRWTWRWHGLGEYIPFSTAIFLQSSNTIYFPAFNLSRQLHEFGIQPAQSVLLTTNNIGILRVRVYVLYCIGHNNMLRICSAVHADGWRQYVDILNTTTLADSRRHIPFRIEGNHNRFTLWEESLLKHDDNSCLCGVPFQLSWLSGFSIRILYITDELVSIR